MDTMQVPPPPPGESAPGERPPLRRPQEGRILAGVAAGVADHLGWDVSLVRLSFVVITLITQGLGLLAYLAAALLIPAAEPGAPRPTRPARSSSELGGRPPSFWLGVGLLAVGAWWLFAVTPIRFGLLPGVSMGSIAAPLLLIAFGLALWVTGDRAPAAPAAPPAPAAPAAPRATAAPRSPAASPASAAAPLTSVATSATGRPTTNRPTSAQEPTMDTTTYPTRQDASATPPTPPEPPTGVGGDWTPPPAPERSRSILGRATVGLMLVTVGVLWTLRLADVLTITVGQLLAAALLVVGLGLLVGAFVGRSRGLIWLGVVLLPLVLVAEVETGWVRAIPVVTSDGAGFGELTVLPTEFEDLEPRYEVGAGSIQIDLTELPFDGESIDLEAAVGAGEIRVIVPDDVEVSATSSVGIGQIELADRSASGLGVGDVEVELEPLDPVGEISLELEAGLGDIEMDVAPAAPGVRD